MASTVTVVPTIGQGLLVSQGGAGATPGFDAIDLRRLAEGLAAPAEGVLHADGWKVSESDTPAMTVKVSADLGLAKVKGDAVADQGSYVVAPHAEEITLTVATADASNPRIDRVVLQIRDNVYDGSGGNDARVMILTGTPTSGATLTNELGVVALPASALPLAVLLVPASDTAITNSQIEDQRPTGEVTALPPSPFNGQEVFYRTPTGELWHCRHDDDNPGPSTWDVLGGQPLRSGATSGAPATLAAWGQGAWGINDANDPLVTVPLAGIYDVHHGAELATAAAEPIQIGLRVDGVYPSAGDLETTSIGEGANEYHNGSWRREVTVAAAGDEIRQVFWVDGAGTTTLYRGATFLVAMPIRVG